MYDLDFIFPYAGITDLPQEIDRSNLFNVSFDINTGDIKLYILDNSERFAYKVSRTSISRQYSATDPEFGADPARLETFLDAHFDYRHITIDAVEGENYYIYIESGSNPEYYHFIDKYCQRFNISATQLLKKVSRINNRNLSSIEQCIRTHGISMVRIPLDANESKIYAQPFLYGNGFTLNHSTEQFLLKLFACKASELSSKLKHAWITTEISTDRTLLVTQNHQLLHSF